MSATSISIARFSAGVDDLLWMPRIVNTKLPPVVYLSGMDAAIDQSVISTISPVLRSIVDEGYILVVPSIAAYWGNSTCATRITNALTYARNTLGASFAPAVVMGASHGGGCALLWTAQNPWLVSCLVTFLPAIDFQTLRVNNTLNVRGSIDTAWGVTYPAALPGGSNPYLRTADFVGVPVQSWTCSDDDISINHAAFESAIEAETHNLGALGHTEAALAAVDEAAVVDFVKENT